MAERSCASCGDAACAPAPATTPAPAPVPSNPLKHVESVYRKPLPSPPATEFSSPDGRAIFDRALVKGGMACFFPLISQFVTQNEPAFCGLASLAMVLNALEIDPGRIWRTPWRWFDESKLDCCEPLDVIVKKGIIFTKVVCLAQCNGAHVLFHSLAQDTSEEMFRKHVLESVRSTSSFIIVSYSRKAFKQSGDGHYSPIGGYDEATDSVLILDVARFKYPPHWVSLSLLWQAMRDYKDPVTGNSRGFLRLTHNKNAASRVFALSLRENGVERRIRLSSIHAARDEAKLLTDPREAMQKLLESLPEPLTSLMSMIPHASCRRCCRGYVPEQVVQLETIVLDQLRETQVYKLVVVCAARPSVPTPASTETETAPETPASVCGQQSGANEDAESLWLMQSAALLALLDLDRDARHSDSDTDMWNVDKLPRELGLEIRALQTQFEIVLQTTGAKEAGP